MRLKHWFLGKVFCIWARLFSPNGHVVNFLHPAALKLGLPNNDQFSMVYEITKNSFSAGVGS